MESLTVLGTAVGMLLKVRRETLAVAESSSGGLINAALVAVPGASAYYLGGAIVYTQAGRKALLGIGTEDMTNIRSASEPFAQLLARRVRSNLGATWGLERNGSERTDGQSLRRFRGACLHCGSRSGRGRDHPGDREPRPRRKHVGFRASRRGATGGVRSQGLTRIGGIGSALVSWAGTAPVDFSVRCHAGELARADWQCA